MMRWRVFVIRVVLGIIFGVLLSRIFFPRSEWGLGALIGGLLVFFAYGFEYLHKRDDR